MQDVERMELDDGADPQVETSLEHRRASKRGRILREVVDLFLERPQDYTGAQLELFERVMFKLIDQVDLEVRAHLSQQLAPGVHTPPQVARHLASDSEISVAGPMLAQSPRLDDEFLVESAKTKSQEHLLAISRRKVIAEPVTDVLVELGNREVAVSTVGNVGARFSEFGYSTLVRRAHGDDDLALAVWVRPEIPRQHLLELFAQASEAVRQKLGAADPGRAASLQGLIAEASNRIQTEIREMSNEYLEARTRITAMHRSDGLNEGQLDQFAKAGRFDEVTIALSVMADVPIGVVERAIASKRTEQILVLAKAIGIAWETTKGILLLQAGAHVSSTEELDQCCTTFMRLRPETAKKALQFYRLREQAGTSN